MKPRPALFALFPAVLTLSALTPGLAQTDEPPEFENEDGYTLTVLKYEASTEIDYEDGDASFDVEFSCRLAAPEGLDVVCVFEELTLSEAIDDRRDDIHIDPDDRDDPEDMRFVAFLEGIAGAELKRSDLTRPAYTVQRMVVVAEAIVARERRQFDLPAIVTNDSLDTPYDTQVRLSEMKIGRNHEAEVVIEYDREDGPGSPLPEAIYALDERGNVLGGGRWTNSTRLLAAEGKFEAEFYVEEGADVASLRLVFLTDYEIGPVEFVITGIFQP